MPERAPSSPSRRSIRLQGFDYRKSGAYFVTICAYQKSCLFGQIRDCEMFVNDLGMAIRICWQQISEVRHNVQLDTFVVMPNHLHGIIFLLDEEPVDLATQNTTRVKASAGKLPGGSLGVIVGQFKRAVTIRSKLLPRPPDQPIWQRNYYEHIVRSERSLNDIRKYIIENPASWFDYSLYVQ